MKRSYKIAAAVAAVLGLGLAATAFAHPGAMGAGMGPAMMHNAKTPEERQKLAEANRAEMQKRAREKGITLPEPHGPGAGMGPQFGPNR